ncbi:hypothetical protein B2I21_31830 [Chryseobacterium mucoviscidosis]|nr:hypothetical protein B2I21_31830 [Chryseobacterium mucoviscidosis]
MAAKRDKLLIFNDDQTVQMVTVEDVSEEAVLTKQGLYQLENLDKHIDTQNGYILYVANVDLPAKMEAANLRQLRRSTALKRMLEFNIQDKPDMFKWVPYFIIAMLILFK